MDREKNEIVDFWFRFRFEARLIAAWLKNKQKSWIYICKILIAAASYYELRFLYHHLLAHTVIV